MNDNYEPCFFDVTDSWQERWSLIRKFTTRWHGIQYSDRQDLIPLVKQQEEKLGFKLPPSFQEYIMFSYDINKDPTNIVIPYSSPLEYLKKLSAISLLRINEGDAFDGVQIDNLTRADPPVETYMLDVEPHLYDRYALSPYIKEEGFKRIETTTICPITTFVLVLIICYLNYNRGCNVEFRLPNYELMKSIETTFHTKSIWENMTIYEMPNIIAILNAQKTKLLVSLCKIIPRQDIPDCLFQYQPCGGEFRSDEKNIFNF